jgi:hypothetical protein
MKRGEECGFGVRVREETLVTGAALLCAHGIGPCPGCAAHLTAAGCESTTDEQARLRRGILWACTSAARQVAACLPPRRPFEYARFEANGVYNQLSLHYPEHHWLTENVQFA